MNLKYSPDGKVLDVPEGEFFFPRNPSGNRIGRMPIDRNMWRSLVFYDLATLQETGSTLLPPGTKQVVDEGMQWLATALNEGPSNYGTDIALEGTPRAMCVALFSGGWDCFGQRGQSGNNGREEIRLWRAPSWNAIFRSGSEGESAV